MRVALLTTNVARGGAETQVAHLAIALRKRGWDVGVISLVKPSAWQDELREAGVPLLYKGIAGVPLILREVRPAILHCHMFHANVLGRMLRLICPVPVVISTLHSLAESSRTSDVVRWRDALYRLTDPLADVTVAVSASVAERHESVRAASRVRVIPNGVDTEVFRPDVPRRERVRAELGVGREFVWLAAGRIMWKKDYPTLLEAFAQLDRGILLIAGAGPDEAGLRASAGANVRFLGARDDLPALMNAADGFVLSSVVEGLPLVLLEAGASGLLCVSTDAGGVRETGIPLAIVPPRDAAALARAMADVMRMPEEHRRAAGEAARAGVREHFDINAVVTSWEKLYRELWT